MLFLALPVLSHHIPHLTSFCIPAAAGIATFPHQLLLRVTLSRLHTHPCQSALRKHTKIENNRRTEENNRPSLGLSPKCDN